MGQDRWAGAAAAREQEPEDAAALRAVLRRTLSNEGVQVDFRKDDHDLALRRHLSSAPEYGDDDDDDDGHSLGGAHGEGDQVAGGAVQASAMYYATKFALTGTSAMMAETATFPIEQIKVRQQLFTGATRASFFGTALTVARTEGVLGLYQGLAPAVLRHVPYTGSRILLYDSLRKVFINEDGSAPFVSKLLVGFTSGAVGQTIAVPTDLVKIRLIGDARKPVNERRYKGLIDAFVKIPREEGGIMALWSGSSPAILRAALVNLGELATYDVAKRNWLATGLVEDDIRCHVLSAAASGLVASIVSCPADVVKSRIMNNSGAYRGILDCAVQTAVFWVTYEQLLQLGGMESF
ncbi:Mitochondrial dicarboxylate carrier [Hondaea fermentalgiana]|uniref:Mitochondrial dicarboxylate carrier n=1 Tax=Hondaea fermentalgiana TaxID=2315210 RepID=A0A2R5GGV5_9STRA|nr:Mitochondrial dicarboxylate carrier [Hondaea fermentalgiana]|eukprot:GBG27084.1 Mitochondrial dicarboxylate carrier [Hondaea fermentalgiana]